MKPDISEFSYGYSITDELAHKAGPSVTAAPVFPSLYREGQDGGGYDLRLDLDGIPLFVQFKLADCMVRNTAHEAQNGDLVCPFYRMHLRHARHSHQHEMLLKLETKHEEVYYCAPGFHRLSELNDAYLRHQVCERSLWILPSSVGRFQGPGEHYVSFRIPGRVFVHPEPREALESTDFATLSERIYSRYKKERDTALTDRRLLELADTLYDIAHGRREIAERHRTDMPNRWSRRGLLDQEAFYARRDIRDELSRRSPLEQVAFYASMYFDLQMFVVQEHKAPQAV
ncbi:MAG: hypothetical protein Q8O86_00755 [Dehalococcoidia bacterium]|nr:hypothetical protein [Dehalococcoidia bacterium]